MGVDKKFPSNTDKRKVKMPAFSKFQAQVQEDGFTTEEEDEHKVQTHLDITMESTSDGDLDDSQELHIESAEALIAGADQGIEGEPRDVVREATKGEVTDCEHRLAGAGDAEVNHEQAHEDHEGKKSAEAMAEEDERASWLVRFPSGYP